MATAATERSARLITGGCGFLGSHLCETLSRQGFPVIAVDNFATGSKSNAKLLSTLPNLRLIEADVCQDWFGWGGDLGPVAQVFHFASPASPPHYQRLGLETMWVNSLGLSKAMQFADRCGAA